MSKLRKTIKYSRYFFAFLIASAISGVFSLFNFGAKDDEQGFSYVSPTLTPSAYADVPSDDTSTGSGSGDDGDCDEGDGDCD